MYAVVETGGKQYRVAPGQTLEVERLNTEAGQPVTLDRVLFVANEGKFSVGAPTVDKATIVAEVPPGVQMSLSPSMSGDSA